MPTDLDGKAQAQATFNAMVIICFVTVALLLVEGSFSKAVVELMSLF